MHAVSGVQLIFSVQGIVALGVFIMLCLAANAFGPFAARIKFPYIAGYIVAGTLAGPFVLGILQQQQLDKLVFINDIALAFIAFCAGSELYFPEIKNLFRTIMIHLACIVIGTIGVISLAVFAAGSAFQFFSDFSPVCKGQTALLFGSLMIERAASSAIAVISETKAKGTLTKLCLGITVASDVVLLVLYAFTSSFAQAACTSLGVNSDTFIALLVSILICGAGGFILGEILIFYLWIPKISSRIRGVLILPTGYAVFYLGHWLEANSMELMGLRIDIEPLLLCLIASCIAGNESKNRRKFANILHKSAPYIFIPFFTLTGSSLDLRALLDSLGLAALLVFSRAFVLFAVTFLAGKYVLKQDAAQYRYLWMTLLPQAGTLLGLTNQLKTYGTWTQPIVSACVAALIINNIIGSKLFKWAIIKSGEGVSSYEFDEEEIQSNEKQKSETILHTETVKIFGIDPLTLAVGVKVCEFGYSTTVIAPKSSPPQKLSFALQYVNTALQTIKSSSRNSKQIIESFSELQYNLATELLDIEFMKKAFISLRLPSFTMDDAKIEEIDLVEEFKNGLNSNLAAQDAFATICNSFQHMIDSDTLAIVLGFPEDQTNWICAQYLLQFIEKQKMNCSEIKLVVLVKEAIWGQKFFKCGLLPVYSLSALTDIISRVAISHSDDPILIDPEDVYEMIHPMEQGTKCGLNIAEVSHVPIMKGFDASPRLLRRMSVRSLFDGNSFINLHGSGANSPSTESQLRESNYNALSGLNTLGLADTTYADPEPKQQPIVFTIFDESLTELNDESIKRESEPLINRSQLARPIYGRNSQLRSSKLAGSLHSISHRSSPSGSYNESEFKRGLSYNSPKSSRNFWNNREEKDSKK